MVRRQDRINGQERLMRDTGNRRHEMTDLGAHKVLAYYAVSITH